MVLIAINGILIAYMFLYSLPDFCRSTSCLFCTERSLIFLMGMNDRDFYMCTISYTLGKQEMFKIKK